MPAQVRRQLAEASKVDRKNPRRPKKITIVKSAEPFAKSDKLFVKINRSVSLPPKAASLIKSVLDLLSQGKEVVVLAKDQELSPNDAASILGISRPLVVHRMDVGDLPFRYVGKHRRTTLKDVRTLKTKIDAQRAAMQALADDAEDLKQSYGI